MRLKFKKLVNKPYIEQHIQPYLVFWHVLWKISVSQDLALNDFEKILI